MRVCAHRGTETLLCAAMSRLVHREDECESTNEILRALNVDISSSPPRFFRAHVPCGAFLPLVAFSNSFFSRANLKDLKWTHLDYLKTTLTGDSVESLYKYFVILTQREK